MPDTSRTTDVTVRDAVPSDAPMLADLGARTFSDTYADFNTPENVAFYLREYFAEPVVTAELTDPTLKFFVAEVDGTPAGYVKLRLLASEPEPTVSIARIYAAKEWHGRGVGPALMQAIIDAAAQGGFATIRLGVWKKNPRAVAFYQKWGFEIVGEEIFQFGDDPQEDYVMARPVNVRT